VAANFLLQVSRRVVIFCCFHMVSEHSGSQAAGGGHLEISEEKVRQIVLEAERVLGSDAHPDLVRKVTRQVIHRLQEEGQVVGGAARPVPAVCLLVLTPDEMRAQEKIEEIIIASGADVIGCARTAYAGQCAHVYLLHPSVRTDEFRSNVRDRLPHGWHALLHPMDVNAVAKPDSGR
jgi:hypothetical protein